MSFGASRRSRSPMDMPAPDAAVITTMSNASPRTEDVVDNALLCAAKSQCVRSGIAFANAPEVTSVFFQDPFKDNPPVVSWDALL